MSKHFFLISLLACLSLTVQAEIASGVCDYDITWSLSDDYVLTLSGEGELYDFDSYLDENGKTTYTTPWYPYARQIKKVEIEEGVTVIGRYAFIDCDHLTSVSMPSTLEAIGAMAFQDCIRLSSVQIPEAVAIIDNAAFRGCKSLGNVVLPESVTILGGGAFSECTKLSSITLSRSLSTIEYNTFYGCTALTAIVIPESVTSIGSMAFYNCLNLTDITLSLKLRSIGSYSFYGCSSLKTLNVPDDVKIIDVYSFQGCTNLETIILSSSLEEINSGAFYNCPNIRDIYVRATTPPVFPHSGNFYYSKDSNRVYEQAMLHVPQGTLQAYEEAMEWQRFTHIQEFDPTGISGIHAGKAAPSPLYDLQGRKLQQKPQKGMYIQGGKKVLVK